jgi:Tol biopolymer transport system component
MRRYSYGLLTLLLFALLLSGCDVPAPPPELPTATAGSSNPESPDFQAGYTPVRIEANKGYTPVPSEPGNIFFVRSSGLWRISPDGSGERQMASVPVNNPPEPSPDGSLVAFTTADAVYVVPSAGGEPRKLASGNIPPDQRLGWTPGGKQVGYFTFDPETMGKEEAWAASVEGGDPVNIMTLTASAVSRGPAYEKSVRWSPDGLFVAVSGANNPFWLLRWPLSTGREGDIREVPGGEPEWSPDGQTIMYAETLSGALLVYGVLAAEATPFRNELRYVGTGLGEYAQGPGPRFSPASSGADSDLIAFRSRTQQGEPQVAIRRRSVGELEPLPPFTNNPAWSPGGDRLVVETGSLASASFGPLWTPNGLSIARLSLAEDQSHQMFPLVKDAMWPAWGR